MDEAPVCIPDASQLQASEQTKASDIIYSVRCKDQVVNDGPGLMQAKGVLDYIVHFLTNSSNEALFCVLACLALGTFVVFGRLGLLLIGVVCGIVLHASWEGFDNYPAYFTEGKRVSKRRELSLEIARRLLDWPGPKFCNMDPRNNNPSEEHSAVTFDYPFLGSETVAALATITDAIMKEYVNYWSEPILPPETTFPLSCRKMLTGFISSMSLHLSRKRAADTFLELLTNSSSLIIVLLNELSAVFESVELPDPPEQIIVRYLETFPESSLANILAKEQQRKNLNIIAGDILSSFLDSKVNSCPLLRNFLCEILANVLFESTISSLSRPEVINGWIIHLLSKGEFEIMTAIDAGVETAQKQGVAAVIATNNLNNVNKSLSTMPDNAKTLRNAQQESSDTDMATEEAEVEAKRLSDMIAAHELQRQNPDKAINDNSRNETTSVDDALRRNSLPAGHPRCAVNIIKQSQTEVIRDQCEAEFKEASKLSKSPSAASTCLNDPNSKNTLPVSIAPSSSLTLYRASITVETDSELGGKGMFRLKPTSTYLLQVEPLSSRSTGWMVFRKYTDFESLHETLETISRLNKIRDFAKDHPALPSWKDQTKSDLAKNLERYLQAALLHESLAESERMRRFLGKDEQLGSGPTSSFGKSVFPLPRQSAFENLGKGVLGVLASAPKIVSGGKTVPEGMTGVFSGGISQTPLPESVLGHDAKSVDLPLHGNKSLNNNLKKESEGSARTRFIYQSGNHLSSIPGSLQPGDGCFAQSTESFSQENSLKKAGLKGEDFPGVIAENLAGEAKPSMHTASIPENKAPIDRLYIGDNEMGSSHEASKGQTSQSAGPNDLKNHKSPITQEETRLAVELIFAVINELYTLSSAWNIRRTLLNAAKSYILRPGNPNLETIRRLLQESMIDGHTSDEAVGMYLNKLRENIFPTETELKHWPPPSSNAEKEQLKETARKVFIKQGLPQALTSVMGTSASREALGKVFDCLQVESIARGFVYTLFLQALKAAIL